MAYNIVDKNENVIIENITEEQAIEFSQSNGVDSEYAYFYYPLDAEILAELKERFQYNDELRFIKRIVTEA